MNELFVIRLIPVLTREKRIFAFDLLLNQEIPVSPGARGHAKNASWLMDKFQLFSMKLNYIRTASLFSSSPDQKITIELDRELLAFILNNKEIKDTIAFIKNVRFIVDANMDIINNHEDYRSLKELSAISKTWINNFGTGNTSLTSLKKMPFEHIKINKDFMLRYGNMNFFRKVLDDVNTWSDGAILTGIDNYELHSKFSADMFYGMQGELWNTIILTTDDHALRPPLPGLTRP
ncbi:diguanylate phosphodiesterase [Dickeya fangzhongdai]|uniref:diguanylate phosphodiesterase n=1 Tax=Dickeya fangzhongdai TaxID=1778540 RepID=UPI0026E0F838|nr:diguanylate phosphodiesterase [Dickeya fangzhongdai]WKV49342.1 diguanylate phosphodiesterase [Dickeya fangzhongdai]